MPFSKGHKMSLFEEVLYEAPGDEQPPDISVDAPSLDDAPPDLEEPVEGGGVEDVGGDLSVGVEPPDLGGGEMGDETPDEFGDSFEGETDEQPQELEIDEKISAILNQDLYQRYLQLLNNIAGQLSLIKNSSDIFYTLNPKSISIIGELKKLDENIRLYLEHQFLNANYSKNLLFFNKCLNLLKILNDIFDTHIKKGIKAME